MVEKQDPIEARMNQSHGPKKGLVDDLPEISGPRGGERQKELPGGKDGLVKKADAIRVDSDKPLPLNMTDGQRTALKNIASSILQNSAGHLDRVGKARESFKDETRKDEERGIYPPAVKAAMEQKSELFPPFNQMKLDKDVKEAKERHLSIEGDKYVLNNVPFPGLDNIEQTCMGIAQQNPGLKGQSIYPRMAQRINDDLKAAGSSERVSVSEYVRKVSPGDSTHAPKYSEDFMLYSSGPNGREIVAVLPGNKTLMANSRGKIK